MIQQLHEQFGIDASISVVDGQGGLPKVCLNNAAGRAEVYLHGAHVTHYQPVHQLPVLWMSEMARFDPPAAIRGGVPVCWPWFGSPDSHKGLPSHGFARNQAWQLIDSKQIDESAHAVTLALTPSQDNAALWPYAFQVELTVTLADTLTLSLVQTNLHAEPVEVAGALHSYFAVGDISQTRIHGLDGIDYLDYVDERQLKPQRGDIRIDQEVDRIYTNTRSDVVIEDQANHRRIRVAKQGSATTVVWNPWQEKTRALVDCVDDAYRRMVCVESVNTLDDSVTLNHGETHQLSQVISSEPS